MKKSDVQQPIPSSFIITDTDIGVRRRRRVVRAKAIPTKSESESVKYQLPIVLTPHCHFR